VSGWLYVFVGACVMGTGSGAFAGLGSFGSVSYTHIYT
jgi:hypothetical protein